MILLTPISFGSYGSQLKRVIDRLTCLLSPLFTQINKEYHHRKRYDKYPNIIGIEVLGNKDNEESEIFNELVARNANTSIRICGIQKL